MDSFTAVDSSLNSNAHRKLNVMFYYLPSAVTPCGHLIFCVRSRLLPTLTSSWITRKGAHYGTCLNPVLTAAECWRLTWNGGLRRLYARFIGVTLRDLHIGRLWFQLAGYYLNHDNTATSNLITLS